MISDRVMKKGSLIKTYAVIPLKHETENIE